MPQQQFHITAAQVFVHLCCGSRKKTNKNKNTTYRWWFQPLLDKYLSTSQSSQNRSELWTKQSYSQEKNIYNINNIHPTKYPLKKGPSSSPPSTEKNRSGYSVRWKTHVFGPVTLDLTLQFLYSRFFGSSILQGDKRAVNHSWDVLVEFFCSWNCGIPSRELTYPTWGRGKSSSKLNFLGGYVSFQEGTLNIQTPKLRRYDPTKKHT